MKKLGKKLILNKKTIDILDEKAQQNVKGGRGAGESCHIWSCLPPSEYCELTEK